MAYTTFDNQIVKIHKATPVVSYANAAAGSIISITNQGIVVACGQNALKLELIQLAGKKPLLIKQIVNGNHPFRVGKLFK
ncbi:MAG: hypothetical protein MJ219_03490 [Mycoplasmoidaceae bacterium]|nr:hypothetical protein [Mycoplasmoidaceae bacterium]